MANFTSTLTNTVQSIAAFTQLPSYIEFLDLREMDLSLLGGTFAFGYVLLLLLTVAVFFNSYWKTLKASAPHTLLPGPSGLPLIGSVLWFLRSRKDASKFQHFVREIVSYGELTMVSMGARTWVFLNSNRVAKEIITKKASVTSDRPDLPISSGLVSHSNRTVLKKTSQWQEGRKLMHRLLSGTSLRTYGEVQEEESTRLMRSYLDTPDKWYLHHYDYAYSIIYRIVLGERPQQSNLALDDFRRITVEFISSIYASIFDFLPDLGRFQPYRNYWRQKGDDHNNVLKDWWTPVRRVITNDFVAPSFVRDVLLKSNTKFANNDEEAMYLASSIVAAGSDNVRRAYNVLMMAVLCYPRVVEEARIRIDAVCGDAKRLPTLEDLDSLPYISAIIKESLRWRPVVPLIPSHHSTEPIEFEGYTFPAGIDFVINSFAVSNEVEQPQEFLPERWDNKELNIVEGLWAFGGGRRICVGYKIAHQELFLALAKLIYCFDIISLHPVDNEKLNHDALGEPFPLRIMPRSPSHARLIQLASSFPV